MASFCSGLQRHRRSWTKSSCPLSLQLVINKIACLSLIVSGKWCPVFHGGPSQPHFDILRLDSPYYLIESLGIFLQTQGRILHLHFLHFSIMSSDET